LKWPDAGTPAGISQLFGTLGEILERRRSGYHDATARQRRGDRDQRGRSMNVGRMSIVSFGLFLAGIIGLVAVVGAHPSAAVIVAYVVVVVVSFAYAMYLWIAVIRYGDRRLVKRGVKGTAQVRSAKETSWAMSAGEYEGIGAPTVWKYGLDVTAPDREPYQTTLYICAHLREGETLPVYVSRLNPKRVTVDLAEQAAARASAPPARDGRTKVRVVANANATAPSTSPAPDLADELTKLADLRDRGALTDAEFEAQKAKLLEESD
jgi:hypothetical protein